MIRDHQICIKIHSRSLEIKSVFHSFMHLHASRLIMVLIRFLKIFRKEARNLKSTETYQESLAYLSWFPRDFQLMIIKYYQNKIRPSSRSLPREFNSIRHQGPLETIITDNQKHIKTHQEPLKTFNGFLILHANNLHC